jgi:predicted alpha/beta superfamily hydrolase
MTPLRGVIGLAVLLSAATVLADQPIEIGREITIRSDVLGEERTVFVRTPEGFGEASRHPVLYLTDARAQFQHTAATVRFLAGNGLMPEMIVVGITNTDRNRDLTPTRAGLVQPGGRRQELPTSGGGDRFLDFVEQELMPLVEARYHPAPYRLFAGHSFGGLLGIHALLDRADLFGAYICVSPALTWDNGVVIRQTTERLSARDRLDKTLVVTVGSDETQEMLEGVASFEAAVRAGAPDGLVFVSKTFVGDDHGSVVLGSHLFGLRKVFEGWRPLLHPSTGRLAGGLEALKAHYAGLSTRFGYPILPPEAIVNQLGYAALFAGDTEEAITLFEMNVTNYPDSANVYDSLGEGLEAAGRLTDALMSYQKAITQGEKTQDPNLEFYREHLKVIQDKL